MDAELRELLYGALGAFADARGLAIAYPNVAFDPAALPHDAAHYLRAATLPLAPELIGLNNGESSYLWLAQVSVYAREGEGELAALGIAEGVREAFPPFHEFEGEAATFRVIRAASILPPVPSSGWFFFPVQLRVQAIR